MGAEHDKDRPTDVLSYASPSTGRMMAIARFPDAFQARMAAAKLHAEGIGCGATDMGNQVYGFADPAIVAVQNDDLRRAVEILAGTPARRFLTVPTSELPPAAVVELPTCPRCDSPAIGRAKRWGRVVAGYFVFFGVTLLNPAWLPESAILAAMLAVAWGVLWLRNRPMHCSACGHRWRSDGVEQTRAGEQAS
jgi:hypothetical protein